MTKRDEIIVRPNFMDTESLRMEEEYSAVDICVDSKADVEEIEAAQQHVNRLNRIWWELAAKLKFEECDENTKRFLYTEFYNNLKERMCGADETQEVL